MRNHGHRALLPITTAIAASAISLTLTLGAQAQVSAAQQGAIKSSCRSDFMAKCSGVTPGGQEALTCLQTNVASLSAACKSAVSATLPPPAAAAAPAAAKPAEAAAAPTPAPAPQTAAVPPAPAPVPAAPPKAAVAAPPKAAAAPTAAQQSAMKQACRSDFMAKCSGVTPGGKDALACLQKNVSTLSPNCKQVVSATLGATPAAVAAATTPAVAPAAGPTQQQLKALKFTCRGDFQRYCRGVPQGGPEAIGCLQTNAPRLSPNCKTSLADIADSIPASAATPTAAAAPVAAAPARRLPPGITPAGRILRRVMERNQ